LLIVTNFVCLYLHVCTRKSLQQVVERHCLNVDQRALHQENPASAQQVVMGCVDLYICIVYTSKATVPMMSSDLRQLLRYISVQRAQKCSMCIRQVLVSNPSTKLSGIPDDSAKLEGEGGASSCKAAVILPTGTPRRIAAHTSSGIHRAACISLRTSSGW
jgi:hypothetical protein